MKSKLILGTMLALLLVGSVSFADDDADKKRLLEEYDKMQEEKAKLAAEARELGIKPGDVKSVEEVEAMIEAKKLEEAKPKTEAERLELTRKKAMNKLDFYERVVRSVAREENEVSDYYRIMGEEKQKSTVMVGTTPEEAPTEAETKMEEAK